MINRENQREILETLNNIVFEYKAQIFALGYLGLLSKYPEILSDALQRIADREAKKDTVSLRSSKKHEGQEEKVTLASLLESFLEFLQMLVLAKNAEEKLPRLLPNSVLVYSMSIWESFLRDYFRVVLRYNWEVLSKLKNKKEGKSFTIGELIEIMMTYDDIREIIIEEFLYTTFYGPVDKIAERFQSLGIINLREFPKWEQLKKYYLIRNVVVHNNGKVSHKLSKELDLEVGTKIELTSENINEVMSLVYDFIDYVHGNITKKYNLDPLPSLSTFLKENEEKK